MTFATALKRYYAFLPLSLIAVIAYLQARAMTLLIGALLEASTPARASVAPALAAKPTEPRSAEPVLQRHPPDSLRGTPTSISADLRDPCVAFTGDSPKSLVSAVWFEAQTGPCQAALFLPRTGSFGSPPVTPPRASGTKALERSGVDDYLKGDLSLLSGVRIVPEQHDGAVVGLRLFGVRPTSLLGRLGLRDGDRLETLNGLPVSTPEQALLAYSKLRTASRIDVHLTRAGKPTDLTLRID